MQQNPRIKVHTAIAPPQAARKEEKVTWRVLPHPRSPNARRRRMAARRVRAAQQNRPKHTLSERLLRNTAVACALILGALALSSIDAPWSQQAAEGIRQALTMNVELDEHLGGLQFVQRLMPESALVFWNMGNSPRTPVEGALSHSYTPQQPWQEYTLTGESPVRAAMDGIVAAMGQGADGAWSLMVNHSDGLQTVYAFLDGVDVRVGQEVQKGAALGSAGERLYFELRSDGVAIDPAEELPQ